MIQAVETLGPTLGITAACEAIGLPRGSFYHAHAPVASGISGPASERLPSPRALTPVEKTTVREVLNSERFQDQAPREVYATLLDEERYLCSWRTMYRILAENQEIRVELGYHETAGPRDLDRLLPLCPSGYLQSLRGRLDDRRT